MEPLRQSYWVPGSPSAAENPPRDRVWRQQICSAATPAVEAEHLMLDFRLEPHRTRIDIDNLCRLALDGLRDAGVVRRGLVGLESLTASKRADERVGLAITAVAPDGGAVPHRGSARSPDLVVEASFVPRGDRADEKRAWREIVRSAMPAPSSGGFIGVEIEVRSARSLSTLLKPVIDGLEPYLGRDPRGRLEFCPCDEQITLLRARRTMDLPCELRVSVWRV
jgi:hypothetical protein